VGDYLDYRIRVLKSGRYNMEIRVACLSTAGIIQVQQMNDSGTVLNSATINLPVTGGWQTWKSIVAEVTLTEGVGKLRVKILKPEFNLNWYKFSEKGEGTNELKDHGFNIFPNPAHDVVTIEFPLPTVQNLSLLLKNVNGVLMKSVEIPVNSLSYKLYTGDLPEGFYFLEISGSGMTYRAKLIVA